MYVKLLYLVTPLYTFLRQGILCKIRQLCNAYEVLFLVEWDTVRSCYTIHCCHFVLVCITSQVKLPLWNFKLVQFLLFLLLLLSVSSSSVSSSPFSSSSSLPSSSSSFFLTPWELVCVALDAFKWQQVHALSVLSCRFHFYTVVFPGSRSSGLRHCRRANVSQCREGIECLHLQPSVLRSEGPTFPWNVRKD